MKLDSITVKCRIPGYPAGHRIRRSIWCAFMAVMVSTGLCGCSRGFAADKTIVRIGHNQSGSHPPHIALTAFEEFIEERLGSRYEVEVYPSELLGSQTDMVQLTQTGAIDFCVASNAILETFNRNYEIFNLPYLFVNDEAYHAVMDDADITDGLFKDTVRAGFEAVTWLDAGTRNFYTVSVPVEHPADLKGLKIRVQQSPTNVEMMRLLGGSATPMGFGDVYTALQSKIIDGAENNELALTNNGHGDVCKYYSYDMHQMVPDILIGNYEFLSSLSDTEREIFEEGFKLVNEIERREWTRAVEEAKDRARTVQGVEFLYPKKQPFIDACLPLHEKILSENPEIRPVYDAIQEYNTRYEEKDGE